MPRKPLSAWETKQKKLFDEAIKKYSVQAVENIWKIANTSMDSKTRLNANIWLADKFIGKAYHVCEAGSNHTDNNITIRLVSTGESYKPNTKDEQEIWDVENKEELLYQDEDDWGEEIYTPSK